MPWVERSVMTLREEFVRLASREGANRQELCRRFGISRETGYKWLRRYRAAGLAGLREVSRRPRRSPERTAEAIEAEVLRVRAASNNVWGGRKIRTAMVRAGQAGAPAASTITAILRRHGKLVERAAEHPGPYRRFERAAPNELWQMDYKGHFALPVGRCHPLTVLDDHSRYSLALEACGDEREATVRGSLIPVFRRHGLPWAMVMDNGPPWGDEGDQPYTVFTVWLLRLGIAVSHGRPRHPQTQGKDERFHRTLKAEVLQGKSFRDLVHCQGAFDAWRQIYNFERPHDALGGAAPGERYRPSPRPFPERLPAIEYTPDDVVRKVDRDGFISFHNHALRLSKAFRGEPVALRPSGRDGQFTVHYCAHRVAVLDLTQAAPCLEMIRRSGERVIPTIHSPAGHPQQKSE